MATLKITVTPAKHPGDNTDHLVDVKGVGSGKTTNGAICFTNVAYGTYEVWVCCVYKGWVQVNKIYVTYGPITCSLQYACTCLMAVIDHGQTSILMAGEEVVSEAPIVGGQAVHTVPAGRYQVFVAGPDPEAPPHLVGEYTIEEGTPEDPWINAEWFVEEEER